MPREIQARQMKEQFPSLKTVTNLEKIVGEMKRTLVINFIHSLVISISYNFDV